MSLHTIERVFRRKVLAHYLDAHHGSRTEAAKSLGITRSYLHRLIRDLGVTSVSSSVSLPSSRSL